MCKHMDIEGGTSMSSVKCCDCGCPYNLSMNRSFSGTWFRSVKRKIHGMEGGENYSIPGFDIPQVARIEISNERDMLQEMVANQQETIQELSLDLDEERNASSSSANEAMSMIIRLQREKAEIQMEARQFKRFAEEKMAHDQEELSVMDDLLFKREEAMQSLYCEVQAYKHRMMSYGLSELEADRDRGPMTRNNSADEGFDFLAYDYPPLRCNMIDNQEKLEGDDDICDDFVKYAFGHTPRSSDHLQDLEFRINQLEKSPRKIPPVSPKTVFEKVIVGQSPKQPTHVRRFSRGSANSFSVKGREMGPDSPIDSPNFGSNFRKRETSQMNYMNLKNIDTVSEAEDKMSDRVYTVDSVHQESMYNDVKKNKPSLGVCDDYLTTPKESFKLVDLGDPEIMKLYIRLQALEADRESMRQAIVSMRTDKAQVVLLKEIAQQLCKDIKPAKRMPVKKKTSMVRSSSVMSVFKWICSFVFWRKKARQSKFINAFGQEALPGSTEISIKDPYVEMVLEPVCSRMHEACVM